jgi:hypothetical protein
MRRGLPTRVLVCLLVSLTAMTFASAARAAECDPVLPVADLTAGMTGTGWTVAQGRTKVPFDVEILGVAQNGIGLGRDLIVVQVSSPELDDAGGIWAGMSGSPVYVGADLVGAVSYGFSNGPSFIGGVTPAEDMLNLLGIPSVAPAATRAPRSVRLPSALARTVAQRTGASVQDASTLEQLRVPLSISGLGSRSLKAVNANFRTHPADTFIPYAGTSAPLASAPLAATIEPGDNLAAAISYGDVTAAAIGTATYSCDGQALGFGHPFLFSGATGHGANAADAFAIVPESLGAPFKFAQVAEPLGVIDQDRLAGVRISLGGAPSAIPVQTIVNVPELGARREGLTEVVANDWAGYLTFLSIVAGVDSVFDASGSGTDFGGRGTVTAWWTFEGTRDDGTPWKIDRGNRWVSKFQIGLVAALNPGFQLDSLIYNPTEQITITSAKVSLKVEKEVKLYTIKDVLVAKGNGRFHAKSRVSVQRGSKLRVRVVLRKFTGGTKNLDYTFRMPKKGKRLGRLEFFGSRPFFEDQCYGGACFVDDGGFDFLGGFDAQLDGYRSAPRNDQVYGSFRLGSRLAARRSTRLDGVVVGFAGVIVLPDGTPGGPISIFDRPR